MTPFCGPVAAEVLRIYQLPTQLVVTKTIGTGGGAITAVGTKAEGKSIAGARSVAVTAGDTVVTTGAVAVGVQYTKY